MVDAGLVMSMVGRLDLERGVLDRHREVFGDAGLEFIQQFGIAAPGEALLLDNNMCGEDRQARADAGGVQVVHSDDVGHLLEMSAYLFEIKPRGAVSNNTDPASRRIRAARGAMSAAIRMPAIASARVQPVKKITTAPMITATDPSASLTTSRKAARMLRLLLRPPTSTKIAMTLAMRPTMPMMSIPVPSTSAGVISRRTPSTNAKMPTARRIVA